ncbi:MAG: PAS domain S-box protein [Nitrospiraceae bacterium]
MSDPAKATVWRIAAIITLSAGVFIADLALPLGVVVWALYVVLLLFCLWVRQRQMPLWLAAGYTILLALGFLYAPPGIDPEVSLTNRVLGGAVIWGIAGLILLRQRADTALRRKEEELTDFFENAVEALNRSGPDGRILWANKAELDLLGCTLEEYIGHHVTEFHVDKDLAEKMLERLARGETLESYESRLRCKDGRIKHVLIDANVLWEKGKFVHTRSFTRDITALREAQEKIKVLRGLLPICSSCNKVRDDNGYWNRIEVYITERSEAEFSHGVCPDCSRKLYPQYSDETP